jgi:hypothetical protein
VEGVRVLEVGDRTFLAHQGGKPAVVSKLPLKSPDDLSVAYTSGVGRVSQAIAADPERVWDLTVKGDSVAVLTDGTAVLGLGAIGPAGILHPGRAGELDPQRRWLMERSNPRGLAGGLEVALAGADVFVRGQRPGGAAAGPGRHHGPPGDPVRAGQPGARDRARRGPAERGLASLVDERELDADLVIPSVFDRRVAPTVSRAVQETVERTGLSRLVESG